MSTAYDKAYFIAKFEAIPAKRFTSFFFRDGATGARCAIGQCGVDSWKSQPELTKEAVALIRLFGPAKIRGNVSDRARGFRRVMFINNVDSGEFPQKTPKQRILAALRSLP